MRSLPARLLALFLAVLPVAWGTCPCWIGSGACGTAAKAGEPQKRCCCCKAERAKPASPGAPSRTAGRGGDDDRRNCCDGCPILEVRHGATPAPVTVAMPEVALLGWVLAVPEPLHAAAVSFAPQVTAEPTGPPPLVGTVVLLV